MKKNLLFLLAVAVAASLMFFSAGTTNAKNNVSAGTVIKGAGNSTLYYVAEDGKRYVFPNANTYFSWFDDFSQVEEVTLEDLYEIPLGGNVTYKPGVLLVKIQTDPKVYAVGANGKLKWLKTEDVAKALYGDKWNKLVDDVPDSFFTNYDVDEAIESEDDFDPTAVEDQVPTISHNKGFKTLAQARTRTRNEKMCGRLEGALERLQKRFERWGADITDEADQVLEACYGIKDDLADDKKVTVCHEGETLSVGALSVRAHIKHGDTLGACADSSSDDESSEDDTATETEDTEEGTNDDATDDTGTSTDETAVDDDSEDEENDTTADDSGSENDDNGSASSSDETVE